MMATALQRAAAAQGIPITDVEYGDGKGNVGVPRAEPEATS
jgi:hypothetical protein